MIDDTSFGGVAERDSIKCETNKFKQHNKLTESKNRDFNIIYSDLFLKIMLKKRFMR